MSILVNNVPIARHLIEDTETTKYWLDYFVKATNNTQVYQLLP